MLYIYDPNYFDWFHILFHYFYILLILEMGHFYTPSCLLHIEWYCQNIPYSPHNYNQSIHHDLTILQNYLAACQEFHMTHQCIEQYMNSLQLFHHYHFRYHYNCYKFWSCSWIIKYIYINKC